MCAALAAREAGAEVALLLEDRLGESGNTALASGGLAAQTGLDASDSPELHLADMRRAARDLLFPDLADVFIAESAAAIHRLAALGARFALKDGRPELFAVPGHSRPRSVRCEGGGTRHLVGPLSERVRERGVSVVEGATVTALAQARDGRVTGVAFIDARGRLVEMEAGAVVLATGGLGQLFRFTSNHPLATGSGYLLALRAGCVLADLEFLQFTPTTLCHPPELRGVSTGGGLLAQDGVRLVNSRGERFMRRYDPGRMEGATRDVMARALYTEIAEGRASPHGGVFLDMSGVERRIVEQVSGRFLGKVEAAGIDPFASPVEVAPEMHFAMGGIAVDVDGGTGVAGLFAAGEAAAGLHGATRLNSQGLTEGAVFGHRAGLAAAAFAGAARPARARRGTEGRAVTAWLAADPRTEGPREALATLPLALAPPTGSSIGDGAPLDAAAFRTRLNALVERGAGIVRSEERIRDALAAWESLAAEAGGLSAGVVDPRVRFRLAGMLALARLLLEAARLRTESRGAHYRSDHPGMDPGWATHVCFGCA